MVLEEGVDDGVGVGEGGVGASFCESRRVKLFSAPGERKLWSSSSSSSSLSLVASTTVCISPASSVIPANAFRRSELADLIDAGAVWREQAADNALSAKSTEVLKEKTVSWGENLSAID
jgi:hypothetical protein